MKRARQSGVHLPEFAVASVVFFMVLFGVIETARALFVWNTLTEATRRGARVATVCHPVQHLGAIRAAAADLLPDLDPGEVVLTCLGDGGTIVSCADFVQIRYVRVEIDNAAYQHQFMVPFLSRVLTPPRFETTLPRESLGIPRVGVGPECPFPA